MWRNIFSGPILASDTFFQCLFTDLKAYSPIEKTQKVQKNLNKKTIEKVRVRALTKGVVGCFRYTLKENIRLTS